jgi:mannitol/fructose-specific phosphotransferase system IIA component (Ntr-type)
MLDQLLPREAIEVGVEVADREAAVRAAGRLLEASGAVEARYVDAMCAALEELGPYCVIAPAVALPHAKPEDGVRRTAISLVTLRDPVEFGHASNDPVSLVIALAPVDKEAHLSALQELAGRLSDRATVDQVVAADDGDEVYRLLVGSTGSTG